MEGEGEGEKERWGKERVLSGREVRRLVEGKW